MATKKTTGAAAKKTAKKTTAKKAPVKKTAAKATKKTTKAKATTKTAAKSKTTAKKTTAKKTAAKKTTAKKTATKKAAPAKKTTPKATASKTTTTKAPAKKKTAAKATKKTAAKKAVKEAAPKPVKPANVGQAPRRTTSAASIPTPTTIIPREAPQADKQASEDKEASSAAKQNFKVKDKIVYPAHGVGMIAGLEKQEVAGIPIELFIIDFEQEKMKLRVPTGKAKAAGMRPLSSDSKIKDAINTLKGRARIKRTMWSRRAQEYDAKINSGDIILVAEVVRDLFRSADQPEQSYSERQLFEAALDRMAREVAAVKKVDLGAAIEELDGTLRKKAATAA
ncbi:MAG: CarD family transcriptional regulator [Pseudomonadota bacterium]